MSNTETRPAGPTDQPSRDALTLGIPRPGRLPTVALLIGKQSGVIRVFASEEEANARRDSFNADPVLDGESPDPDAPYTVQSWAVSS